MESVVAVDLGGTWIRAASVSSDGKCGPLIRKATQRNRSYEEIIADIKDVIKQSRVDISEAVAIGIPTVLDETNRLVECDNLPTLGGFPLGEFLQEHEQLPVKVFNDASCFAVGEWWHGAGQGTTNLCGVTLGTGLGVGMILNGKLYQGSHGYAGEIWKSRIGEESVEELASGVALERLYAQLSGKQLAGANIAIQAREGDSAACEAFDQFGRSLGKVVTFLVNAIDPEVVVFGGAVSESFDFFSETLCETVLANTTAGEKVRLEKTMLGERAALLGAARLYWGGLN